MNIEAHNLDSLRNMVRKLQAENQKLKEQLKAANIPFSTENIFEEKVENTEVQFTGLGGHHSVSERPFSEV